MHTLTIEVNDETFHRLAGAGCSYLAYDMSSQRGAEVQAQLVIKNALAGWLTPDVCPRPGEVFAG